MKIIAYCVAIIFYLLWFCVGAVAAVAALALLWNSAVDVFLRGVVMIGAGERIDSVWGLITGIRVVIGSGLGGVGLYIFSMYGVILPVFKIMLVSGLHKKQEACEAQFAVWVERVARYWGNIVGWSRGKAE